LKQLIERAAAFFKKASRNGKRLLFTVVRCYDKCMLNMEVNLYEKIRR